MLYPFLEEHFPPFLPNKSLLNLKGRVKCCLFYETLSEQPQAKLNASLSFPVTPLTPIIYHL